MCSLDEIIVPSNAEQELALASYQALQAILKSKDVEMLAVIIDGEEVEIPAIAIELLLEVLRQTSQGKAVSIAPVAQEITTQKAADILGISRPTLNKLLEEGKIPFTRPSRHRRLLLRDVLKYREEVRQARRKALIELMQESEDTGLYDTQQ